MDAVVHFGRAVIDDLVKRAKRVAVGITNWTNCRTRALLYTGRPNWALLDINSR